MINYINNISLVFKELYIGNLNDYYVRILYENLTIWCINLKLLKLYIRNINIANILYKI